MILRYEYVVLSSVKYVLHCIFMKDAHVLSEILKKDQSRIYAIACNLSAMAVRTKAFVLVLLS